MSAGCAEGQRGATYRGGRGRGSSSQQIKTRPSRPSPTRRTSAPLYLAMSASSCITRTRKKPTGMPCLAFDLDKLHPEQVLVNVENGGDDLGNREVLFDEHIVEIEAALDKFAVIVPVVPKVELAVERQTLLVMFFLLQGKERLSVLETNRTELLFEICQEL